MTGVQFSYRVPFIHLILILYHLISDKGLTLNVRYIVEVTDPPPGWDDRDVEFRHRLITSDHIEQACTALLGMSHKLWLKAGMPGKAAPAVTVRLVSPLSRSSF